MPLKIRTPDRWAEHALADPLSLLNDHAHLERKAAANALELIGRWPEKIGEEKNNGSTWVKAMTAITKDEIKHFAQVVKIIEARGAHLTKGHRNPYAQKLRSFIRLGDGQKELVDRLLVSALIELRSCERFEILGRVTKDPELQKLYRGLWASEHGHFRLFLQAAESICPKSICARRWQESLVFEASALKNQVPGSRMHSGW